MTSFASIAIIRLASRLGLAALHPAAAPAANLALIPLLFLGPHLGFSTWVMHLAGGLLVGCAILLAWPARPPDGAYAYVRYPCYTANILAALGLVFFFQSLSGLIYVPLLAGFFAVRVRPQEYYRLREYGDAYRAYQNRVLYCLLPFVY